MTIIQTVPTTTDPRTVALAFSAILAADKGIGNEVKAHEGGWLVVADDGRAIHFTGASSGD